MTKAQLKKLLKTSLKQTALLVAPKGDLLTDGHWVLRKSVEMCELGIVDQEGHISPELAAAALGSTVGTTRDPGVITSAPSAIYDLVADVNTQHTVQRMSTLCINRGPIYACKKTRTIIAFERDLLSVLADLGGPETMYGRGNTLYSPMEDIEKAQWFLMPLRILDRTALLSDLLDIGAAI